MIAMNLANLAIVALRAADHEAAAASLRESLHLFRSIGDAHDLAEMLSLVAATTLARGDAEASARLCAASDAICGARGFELDRDGRQQMAETRSAVRAALAENFEPAWADGLELDLEAAVELALHALN